MSNDSPELTWESVVGKYVLVGFTENDHNDVLIRHLQFHGRIVAAGERTGILIELAGDRQGETYCLPPSLESLAPAPPGQYRLHSTGEIVNNPDLLSSWTKTNAPPSQQR